MVDVVELKPDEALPEGEASVVVGPTEDESGMTINRSWTYFSYLPDVPGARERRIAEAKRYAEEQGLERVYVAPDGLGDRVGKGDAAVTPLKVEAESG